MVHSAIRIANQAHAGQTRKFTGEPYICHPAAVAALCIDHGPETVAVAWLHDVVEDTDVTLDDLRDRGMPDSVVEAVALMTRDESGNQDYERDYLPALAANPLARAVKLADLKHNLSTFPDGYKPHKREKYLRSLAGLSNSI